MNLEQFFSQNQTLLLLIALWSLPWKGYALWRASERKEKWGVIFILIANTAGILEILYIFIFSHGEKKAPDSNDVS